MSGEFDLIARHFRRPTTHTRLAGGDDAALLDPAPDKVLVVTTDMLLAGRHFALDAEPRTLGRKALAVNLSDLAAMGAQPRWAFLALAVPAADEDWLAAFAAGFYALATEYGVDLAGGDTARGPLTISVTAVGEVNPARVLRRDAARPGDDIYVSGTLGDAALGLAHLEGRVRLTVGEAGHCLARLHDPSPRVHLGRRLCELARAAVDLSDGLISDLGHVLAASGVGAEIAFAGLPLSAALRAHLDDPAVRALPLAGGDDYELCFTASPSLRGELDRIGLDAGVEVTRIGRVRQAPGLVITDRAHAGLPDALQGFDHFAGRPS